MLTANRQRKLSLPLSPARILAGLFVGMDPIYEQLRGLAHNTLVTKGAPDRKFWMFCCAKPADANRL